MNYYKEVLKKYAVFNGRATRAEYWYFVLFNLIISIAIGIISKAITGNSIISNLYSLAVLIPSIAVGVRRLHDVGKSGWFLLLAYAPFVSIALMAIIVLAISVRSTLTLIITGIVILGSLGFIIYFITLMLRKGDIGINKYGPDPKEIIPLANSVSPQAPVSTETKSE